MNYDILPLIPSGLPLVLLDSLLRTLTHTSPYRRRGSLLLFLLAFLLGIHLLLNLRTSLNSPRLPSFPLPSVRDERAAIYDPSAPSAQHIIDYERLARMIESRSSAYPASVFRERSLRSETSPVVGVTAIVLNWERRRGLDLVLKHVTRYPFVREVIVWNNQPAVQLKPSDFRFSSPPESDLPPAVLRIVNSPSNVRRAGTHFACSMASYEHCYFSDDRWLNLGMDSTYTKYLECCAGSRSMRILASGGGRISSSTLPRSHIEQRRWQFDNPDISLHAGFTSLGTGTYAPRHFSSRFVQQQAASSLHLSRRQRSLAGDAPFSIWSNSYQEQMPSDLVLIDVDEIEGVKQDMGDPNDVREDILTALRVLHDVLTLFPALSPHPFPITAPPPESLTRAPCANDGCLFVTSLTPFPNPAALRASYAAIPAGLASSKRGFLSSLWLGGSWKINSGTAAARVNPTAAGWTIMEHEGRFNTLQRPRDRAGRAQLDLVAAGGALGGRAGPGGKVEMENAFPDEEWWVRNGSWHLAVDGRGTETCWESSRAPDADDHFGLTLIKPRAVRQLTVVGSLDLANTVNWEDSAGSESWQVLTVRADGSGGWEPRSLLGPPNLTSLPNSLVSVTLSLDPIRTPTTYALRQEGNHEVDEEGREVAVRKIKFVSRGKKRERVTVGSDAASFRTLSPPQRLSIPHESIMLTRTAILATLATAASAQLGSLSDGLSSSCQSSAISLFTTGGFATCAGVGSLISVFTASGSIIKPIDDWLESVCTQQNCTEADINNATSIIDQGCSSEIDAGQVTVTTIRKVIASFNDVKEGLCLASTSNGTFCVTNGLTDVQNATGSDLSFSSLSNLNASSLASVPAGSVCTDCAHGLVSTLGPIFGANSSDTVTGAIAAECGESFNDGQIPSTVSEKTTSNSTSNGGSVESNSLSGAGVLGVGAWKIAGAALAGVVGLTVLA
ncbi:hypothetical protein JCM11641_004262 [Rhodosporidiobolus odoratus]